MCVRLLTTFLVASDLFVLLLYCFYFMCIFVFFVLNFLHCSTGQKLVLSGRCILSIFLYPFIFIVYLVYDFIIKIKIKIRLNDTYDTTDDKQKLVYRVPGFNIHVTKPVAGSLWRSSL